MTEKLDLWPDFDPKAIRSPKSILTEQAGYLTEKTKNILLGEVSSGNGSNNRIVHFLKIVAPSMNNYKFSLLHVYHDPVLFYPCQLSANGGTTYSIENEENLLVVLKEIFTQPTTIKIINSLYSQCISNEF